MVTTTERAPSRIDRAAVRVILAKKTRDGEGLGKAEDVDRLEAFKDEDADPLRRWKGSTGRSRAHDNCLNEP
jgi:hypothetical protein